MTRMTEVGRDKGLLALMALVVFAELLLAVVVAVAWPRPIDQQRECCTDWPEDGK